MIEGDKLPTLEAPRVRLRWLTADDVDALFDVFSDRVMMRYWSSPAMTERAEAEALLARIHRQFADKFGFQWGIERKDDGRILGTCTLFQLACREHAGRARLLRSRAPTGNRATCGRRSRRSSTMPSGR